MSLQIDALPPDWDERLPPLFARTLPREGITAERFVRQVLLDPNFQPDGAFCAQEAGETVGFCLAIARQVPLENAPPEGDRGYVTLLCVAPDRQRQGIGRRLLQAAERWLGSQGRRSVWVSPYAPGYFMPGADLAYPAALPFFVKQGYAEVYRPLAMQADLWGLGVPDWVAERERRLKSEGVRVTPYHPRLTLPLLEFAKREFAGDWVRWVREGMAQITLGEPAARLIVAWETNADGAPQVLGFSHFLGERFGPIGVASSQRGRGIGQVLMYATLMAQKAQGLRAAWFLWSDDRTAERIYTAAGFREIRRFVLLKKELEHGD
jgi:GNAT superfamily N-acetyltransferase